MTANHDLDLIVSFWLDEGPVDLPDATRRAVLTSLPTIRQARRGPFAPWRFSKMITFTRLAAAAIVAVVAIGGAMYLLNPPGGFGPGGPTATPVPTATPTPPAPTRSIIPTVQAGTITLTDDACTWAGNPSPIAATGGPVVVRFSVRNETDTFGNFGIFHLDKGTWEEAAAWMTVENASLHGGPSQPPQDFATEVGTVDAPERETYPTGLILEPGTYGVVCSSNEPPPGLVFAVYLAGPLEVAGE